jgi:hypothetical protein
MEFAIPLVALGGLYISSNTNNQGKDNGKVKRDLILMFQQTIIQKQPIMI